MIPGQTYILRTTVDPLTNFGPINKSTAALRLLAGASSDKQFLSVVHPGSSCVFLPSFFWQDTIVLVGLVALALQAPPE